jgi:glycerophosphoryl diester phosphodiesterase
MGVTMQIFGHRGACGYLPENTMESFELAFQLGSDAIEFDVVMTKDGHLVIRHDNDLSHTTDIANHSFLSNKVEELNLEDVQKLRAIERYPEGRKDSAAKDGQFAIPKLSEVLNNPAFNQKHLIIELKFGKHFAALGLNPVEALAEILDESGWQARGMRITIECFEFEILQQLRDRISKPARFVFLSAPDMLPTGFTELTDELLAQIAKNFDGLSLAISIALRGDLVKRAKAMGLETFLFTARVETAEGGVDEWFKMLIETGVDGIFCDQPDQLAKVVSSLS